MPNHQVSEFSEFHGEDVSMKKTGIIDQSVGWTEMGEGWGCAVSEFSEFHGEVVSMKKKLA